MEAGEGGGEEIKAGSIGVVLVKICEKPVSRRGEVYEGNIAIRYTDPCDGTSTRQSRYRARYSRFANHPTGQVLENDQRYHAPIT